MTSLELSGLKKAYGPFQVLHEIDLTVEQGEFIVMVGPSGCGKSTLLKAIAGLEPLNSGTISLNGQDVTNVGPGNRGMAMVFQSYALYPHMTVARNMGFGLRMAKRPKAEIEQAVRRAAEILRMTDQLDKLPRQLSGGQRQRVAIGRAITRSPEVFLFDEPLSNLDAALRTQMRVELSNLHVKLGATMIYVTHDQVEAMTMASRIVVLNAGRIEQVGAPLDLYRNPVNRFVAGFLGAPRMNFFGAMVVSRTDNSVVLDCEGLERFAVPVLIDCDVNAGDPVTLGLRPEAIAPQEAGFVATVTLLEHLGRETVVYADAKPLHCIDSDTGTNNMVMHLPNVSSLQSGDVVNLGFDVRGAYLFAGADERTVSLPKS